MVDQLLVPGVLACPARPNARSPTLLHLPAKNGRLPTGPGKRIAPVSLRPRPHRANFPAVPQALTPMPAGTRWSPAKTSPSTAIQRHTADRGEAAVKVLQPGYAAL